MQNIPFDFQTQVIEQSSTIPVLVDFWAEWCEPCRALAPVLERLAERAGDRWVLVKVNTEAFPGIASQYGVRSIPDVRLFHNGSVIDGFTGALSEYQIEQWLKKALPSPYAADMDRAASAAAAGNESEAVAILEGIVTKEPQNSPATAMLIRLILFYRPAEALALSESLEGDREYADLGAAVRTLAALLMRSETGLPDDVSKDAYVRAIASLRNGDLDGALERFIGVLRENRYYDDDGSRLACIAIFRLLGEEHEITMKHRRSFDRAF
ncbi:MAG: tetratricopeptide repeat protein [Chlorobiaceae bacterium]|nr:tetratricopeptide repeat protein [Chlorobiaceae bacterium]